MNEDTFRLLQCIIDTFQNSDSSNYAVIKIIKDYGDTLTIDQKIQLAKNILSKESSQNKIRINWEGKDYF